MEIKSKILGRGVGFFLTIPAIAFVISAYCLYSATGITIFNPKLNEPTLISLIVSIVLATISMAIDFVPYRQVKYFVKPLRYIAFLLIFYGFIGYIGSQATYIVNIFVAIDGSTFSQGFILTVIFFALSIVFMLISSCLNFWKPWIKKDNTEEMAQ